MGIERTKHFSIWEIWEYGTAVCGYMGFWEMCRYIYGVLGSEIWMGMGWKDGKLALAAGVWDGHGRQNIRNLGNLDIWGFGVWDLRVCMGGWRIGVCGRCEAGSMTNKGAGALSSAVLHCTFEH